MSIDRNTQDDWNDCPQGELSRMVQRLDVSRARVRTRKLYQAGLLSMLLVASGVVLVGSFAAQSGASFGGITCAECRDHFVAYHGHMTGSESLEDLALAKSMAAHLASCKLCQERFNEAYPGALKNAASVAMRPARGHLLPMLAISQQPAYF